MTTEVEMPTLTETTAPEVQSTPTEIEETNDVKQLVLAIVSIIAVSAFWYFVG